MYMNDILFVSLDTLVHNLSVEDLNWNLANWQPLIVDRSVLNIIDTYMSIHLVSLQIVCVQFVHIHISVVSINCRDVEIYFQS